MPVAGIFPICRVICDADSVLEGVEVFTRISLFVAIDCSGYREMDGRWRQSARYPLLFVWRGDIFAFDEKVIILSHYDILCGT